MTDIDRLGATRMTAHVAAYDNGRTPEDGEPDRVVEVEIWQEADGTVIDDNERIQEVKAWIEANR